MQSLIRSKSAGVTGGRGTAGAGPGRDLLYGSRGLPAAPTNHRPGDLPEYAPGAYCGLGGDHAGDWSHRRAETFKSMANSGS